MKCSAILIALFLAGITGSSCQNEKKMEEIHYGTNASCPPDYPINLHSGAFKSPDGEIIVINERELNGPWGVGGVAYIVGDGFNPLPDRLRVGYFSDTEDKFYQGEFRLPCDKIRQLFEEKTDNPFYKGKTYRDTQSGKELPYMKYNALNVGIALNGLVTLWISGERVQTEIGQYKAQEADLKWSDIYDTGSRKENKEYNLDRVFTPKVKQEVLTNTLPLTLWETYLKRYNWKYVVEWGADGEHLEEVYFKMLNAEAVSLYGDNPGINNDSYGNRAVPYNFDLMWTDSAEKGYGARIVFNADEKYYENIYNSGGTKVIPDDLSDLESYRIFKELDSSMPLDVVFKINSSNTAIDVFFKQGNREIQAKNVNVKVFNRNE
jgi:hypothetical protein